METSQLEDLYRRFAPLVHARARRLVGQADADDVVQEVFVRLIRHPPRDEQHMVEWIYVTASNVGLDRLRFRLRRDQAWREAVREHATTSSPASFEAALASHDRFRKLLARMDRKIQEVAVLVYLEEMEQNEVARILDLSRKTIGERLRRFEEQARKLLSRWNQ